MMPASAPAATTVDTTAASGINLQMKRSGSTAETWITHDLLFEQQTATQTTPAGWTLLNTWSGTDALVALYWI
jgi:hypothetical protein